jgi:hypothetical protein
MLSVRCWFRSLFDSRSPEDVILSVLAEWPGSGCSEWQLAGGCLLAPEVLRPALARLECQGRIVTWWEGELVGRRRRFYGLVD